MLVFVTADSLPYFWCQKLILYRYWNHQHICKEYSQAQTTHLLYRKHLKMGYFELQLDYVEARYTPELPVCCTALELLNVTTTVHQGIVMLTRVLCKLVVISILKFVFSKIKRCN